MEVIALAADVGQGGDWDTIKDRALAAGAVEAIVVDVREEFANDFVAPALKANAKYEGKYPLISSLSRPVIVKHLVAAARRFGADAVAHGCTGKGNDQVRFEVSTAALAPDLEVIAPVRGWGLTREQSIEYAEKWDIPITVTKSSPYSIDQNLWGRTIECGILEDPWEQPPEEVYELTTPTATEPTELVITFEEGLPVALDGRATASFDPDRRGRPDRRLLRLGPHRHGREPPGRHQEPGGVRMPGCPGPADGPLRPGGPDPGARPGPREGPPRAPVRRAGLRRPVVLPAQGGAGRLRGRRASAT